MTEMRRWMIEKDREITHWNAIAAALDWDEHTSMPPAAIQDRAEKSALLHGHMHDLIISPRWEEALAQEMTGQDVKQDPFLRAIQRRYRRQVALPKDLVVQMARAISVGQAAWVEAKKNASFASFLPFLEKIVDLSLERAAILGSNDHPYDVLLDDYEPGMTEEKIEPLFADLERALVRLLDRIKGATPVETQFLSGHFPAAKQDVLARFFLREMGYSFEGGRLDTSEHPFATTLGVGDVRITTHYHEDNLMAAVASSLHEGGHALYEQGIGAALHGTILGEGTSFGIHESQSRFWENAIGKSLPFWGCYYSELVKHFPETFRSVSLSQFYRAINCVKPSLIRIEADEVTYGLHVILRFRLEGKLLNKKIRTKDLPEVWNQEMKNLLGVVPENDAMGVLQDVHWSQGSFGYFPSYALGNLYEAQFTAALRRELPDMDQRILSGDLASLRSWLQREIHQHGASLLPEDLIKRVTGEPLSSRFFTNYLEEKFSSLYRFSRS